MSDIIRRRALLGGTRNTDAHECIVEYEFPRSHHNDRFPNSFGTKNITEVNWPEGITGIESYTFRGSSIDCNNFNEIPSTVTQIGKYAFANCLNLQGSITLPENLETLLLSLYPLLIVCLDTILSTWRRILMQRTV